MITIAREHNPRQCSGCQKVRLVLHHRLGAVAFWCCADCWNEMGRARTRVHLEALDSIEVAT